MREWKNNPIDKPWELVNKKEGLTYTLKDWKAGKAIEKPFHDDGWGKSVKGIHVNWAKPGAEGSGGNFSIIPEFPTLFRKMRLNRQGNPNFYRLNSRSC